MLAVAGRKVRAGVSFDSEVSEALDRNAAMLLELGVTRSEIVNAILTEYFDGNGTSEAVWGIVIKRRVKRRR